MFTLLFLVGAIGFTAMAFLSFGHLGGARGHASHSIHAHSSAGATSHSSGAATNSPRLGAKAGISSKAASAKVSPRSYDRSKASAGKDWVRSWFTLTPIDLFAYSLGAGATGLLLKHALTGNLLTWAAVIGALVYNLLLIRPVMNFALRFASRESTGLEGLISSSAEALSRFDDQGRGLVCLHLDGQLIQLLATLDSEEISRGVTIARGDKVIVIAVDPAKNTCRVSRDLAA